MCESSNGKQRKTQLRIRVAAGVREGPGRPGQGKQRFGEVVLGHSMSSEKPQGIRVRDKSDCREAEVQACVQA